MVGCCVACLHACIPVIELDLWSFGFGELELPWQADQNSGYDLKLLFGVVLVFFFPHLSCR